MQSHKTCTSCNRTLPADFEHFYRHKQCKLGFDSRCRECCNAEKRVWKRRNRDFLNARRRERYASDYGPRHAELEQQRAIRAPYKFRAEIMRAGIRERAKAGVAADLSFFTREYIESWLRRQPACECCRTEFNLKPAGRKADSRSPSLDRFNPALGYVRGNVTLICWRCNNLKRNYSARDLRMVAEWMESKATKFDEAAA